jgi:hypothetical protein
MATTRKRKRTSQGHAAFSFSSGAARYAKKEELAAANVGFAIIGVEVDPGGGFTGGDRWKVTVVRDDNGESEIITLPTNEKRDAQLKAARDHIAASGPISGIRLVKRGNAYYFRGAEPPSS